MTRDDLVALVHKHFQAVTLEAAQALADEILERLAPVKPRRAKKKPFQLPDVESLSVEQPATASDVDPTGEG